MARFKPTKSLAKQPKKSSSPENVDKSNDEKPANEEETHFNEDKSNQEKKATRTSPRRKNNAESPIQNVRETSPTAGNDLNLGQRKSLPKISDSGTYQESIKK
jgi:hypothetical protein